MPYKIVSYSSEIKGEYCSLIEVDFAKVTYRISKKAHRRPKCGPLTAFKTPLDARQFMERYSWKSYPIFKVDIVKYNGKKRFLWNTTTTLTELPKGTILCSSITLKKRIF